VIAVVASECAQAKRKRQWRNLWTFFEKWKTRRVPKVFLAGIVPVRRSEAPKAVPIKTSLPSRVMQNRPEGSLLFFFDRQLQVRIDLPVELDGNVEMTDELDRLG